MSNTKPDIFSFDAVLFDLDGVLTATAKLHAACWKQMFDEYLTRRAAQGGGTEAPFDIEADYHAYVDGKPRYDGVRSFLESRGITLPEGDPADPPDRETVCGLGNRKNDLVQHLIGEGRVEVFETSVALVKRLRSSGVRTAVVSSSKNCEAILKAAGIDDLFEDRVDGVVAEALGIRGKPAPDPYLASAKRLGVPPSRAVVVEDAIAGVASGRAGAFGLVVGVDRQNDRAALLDAGADIVVKDLGELLP